MDVDQGHLVPEPIFLTTIRETTNNYGGSTKLLSEKSKVAVYVPLRKAKGKKNIYVFEKIFSKLKTENSCCLRRRKLISSETEAGDIFYLLNCEPYKYYYLFKKSNKILVPT